MRARMYQGSRSWEPEPHTLYPGDIVEGPEAAAQVAAGNAEEIKDKAAEGSVVTPAAEAHAEELGVDLSKVEGTGVGGNITKGDVTAAAVAASATPAAQAHAEELGVDLSKVQGTGVGGNITKADVVAAAENGG